jgi:hypothetical protein
VPQAVAGTYLLKFGDSKLGFYDARTQIYREFENDGKTLGKVRPFPWKTDEEKKEKPRTTVQSGPPPEPEKADPTLGYVVGGSIAGALLLAALAVQFRR